MSSLKCMLDWIVLRAFRIDYYFVLPAKVANVNCEHEESIEIIRSESAPCLARESDSVGLRK